jgi:hypothetical protein
LQATKIRVDSITTVIRFIRKSKDFCYGYSGKNIGKAIMVATNRKTVNKAPTLA